MRKLRLIIFGGLAACLLAQGPMGPGPRQGPFQPRTDEVKAYLGLTDAQVQALQDLRKQERDAIQPIFQQVHDKQLSLREQLRNGSTDAAALGTLLLDIENLQKQVTQVRASFHDKAVNSLTDVQKNKLSALEEAMKLEPVNREAMALNLLAPPQNRNGGPGFGPQGPAGPGAFGRMRRGPGPRP
jgi:Spy/CpxP family protein refolding chaperone